MKNILYTLGISVLLFTNCTNTSEDDLIEPIIIATGETVNYTESIQSIMENNCTFCHSEPPVNGAPMSLITYSDVVFAVDNLNLIDRISRESGEAGAMPFGGPKLPQNLIDLVIQWQDDGLLEN